MDASDADVLIYAAVPDHPLGKRVSGLFSAEPPGATGAVAGIGSALLIPELFTKPMRTGADTEIAALAALVARLDLRATERSAGPTRCRPRRGLRLTGRRRRTPRDRHRRGPGVSSPTTPLTSWPGQAF